MTIKDLSSCVTLSNDVKMPLFGLGTWDLQEGEEVENVVRWALEAGYRSIDTASYYANENGVGNAVKRSGIPREEIFITTKVKNTDQGYEQTLCALNTSLQKLGTDYVDLYLVHWPVKGKFNDTWMAMEKIYRDGKARSVGVSNFSIHHLDALLNPATIIPMVNQVEFHPRLQQPELQEYCREHQIQYEAWSPIMKGQVLDISELVEIGKKYRKSAVQITLRWMVQKMIVTIPKSSRKERIIANADIFDFELDKNEMDIIDSLDRGQRIGEHPDTDLT